MKHQHEEDAKNEVLGFGIASAWIEKRAGAGAGAGGDAHVVNEATATANGLGTMLTNDDDDAHLLPLRVTRPGCFERRSSGRDRVKLNENEGEGEGENHGRVQACCSVKNCLDDRDHANDETWQRQRHAENAAVWLVAFVETGCFGRATVPRHYWYVIVL